MVRLTDRPDMILNVYRGRKTTIQYTDGSFTMAIRLLISSIFGVFYSTFGQGTPVFPRFSSNLYCVTPTFSKRCLWDSYFQNPSENPGYFELVLVSLGKYPIAADIIIFGIIKGDVLFYFENAMFCVLISIASMR